MRLGCRGDFGLSGQPSSDKIDDEAERFSHKHECSLYCWVFEVDWFAMAICSYYRGVLSLDVWGRRRQRMIRMSRWRGWDGWDWGTFDNVPLTWSFVRIVFILPNISINPASRPIERRTPAISSRVLCLNP